MSASSEDILEFDCCFNARKFVEIEKFVVESIQAQWFHESNYFVEIFSYGLWMPSKDYVYFILEDILFCTFADIDVILRTVYSI